MLNKKLLKAVRLSLTKIEAIKKECEGEDCIGEHDAV